MAQEYVEYGEVLYAPSIHIEDNWLKTAALYYDKVHRIVPDGIDAHLSEEARILQDKLGFINNLYPSHQKEIEVPFTDFAKKELVTYEKRQKLFDILQNDLKGFTVKIHGGKTSPDLINKLKSYGLAVEHRDGWNNFDALTGSMYMGFLAKAMAKDRALPIVTSSLTFHNVVDYLNNKQTDNAFKLAALVIDGYVPRDISNVHPDKIVQFRQKYEAEREAFYYEINSLVSDLTFVASKSALNAILLKRKKLIDSAVHEVEKAGKGIGLPFIKGTFNTIVSIYEGNKTKAISSALETIGVAITNSKNEEKAIKYVLALKESLDKETMAKQLLSRKLIF